MAQRGADAQPPAPSTEGGSVIARLQAREAQRAAEAARRAAQLRGAADPAESVAAFLSEFGAQRARLEAAVDEATASSSGGDASAHCGRLREVSAEVAALEASAAGAAYFLPPYDLRQATLAVGALKERLDAAIAARQPRKKFSFAQKRPEAPPAAPLPAPPHVAAAPREPPNEAAQSGGAGGRTISGLRGAVVALRGDEVAGQDFTLSDLEDCTLCLLGPLSALFAHRLARCRLVAGPVAGATFMEGVQDCRVYVAARQVRVHSAAGTDLYLRALSNPVIEHSAGLRFAPWAPAYAGAAAHLETAGMAQDGGQWAAVQDFGWLRAAASPHWAVLPEGEREAPPEEGR